MPIAQRAPVAAASAVAPPSAAPGVARAALPTAGLPGAVRSNSAQGSTRKRRPYGGVLIPEGKKAPAFALMDQSGDRVHLKDFLGRPVIIYFYPKDDSPGCTIEACGFRDLWADLDRTTTAIVGISPDDIASHAQFADRLALPFTLLADPIGRSGVPKVCEKYGVWQEKQVYGRTMMGVVRTTYLIDEAGKVARRWDRVEVEGHGEAALNAARALRPAWLPRGQ